MTGTWWIYFFLSMGKAGLCFSASNFILLWCILSVHTIQYKTLVTNAFLRHDGWFATLLQHRFTVFFSSSIRITIKLFQLYFSFVMAIFITQFENLTANYLLRISTHGFPSGAYGFQNFNQFAVERSMILESTASI